MLRNEFWILTRATCSNSLKSFCATVKVSDVLMVVSEMALLKKNKFKIIFFSKGWSQIILSSHLHVKLKYDSVKWLILYYTLFNKLVGIKEQFSTLPQGVVNQI